MKKFLKFFAILLLIVLVLVAGFYFYMKMSPAKNRNPFKVIPPDAVLVVETDNIDNAWAALSSSNIWKHLLSANYFKDIEQSVREVERLLNSNPLLDDLMSGRDLFLSAHMIPEQNDYDFLFIVDLEEVTKIKGLREALSVVPGYKFEAKKFQKEEIWVLTNKENAKDRIFITLVDNLVVIGFQPKLIEAVLVGKDDNVWEQNAEFIRVDSEISRDRLFNLYFNFNMLEAFAKVYLDEPDDFISQLQQSLTYAALNINLEDDQLSFEGYTGVRDSVANYLNAFMTAEPGRLSAYEITSDKAAIYLSMTFDNFQDVIDKLENQYAADAGEDYESYSKKLKWIQRALGFRVKEHFLNWIGNEIALVKLRPDAGDTRQEDVLMVIHANNIDDARDGLDRITKKLRRRTSLKFEVVEYKSHEIHYWNKTGGLLAKLFGDMFEELEEPFFTYIEDYVIFSNSEKALMVFIDDYIKGKTLSHQDAFMNFVSEFEAKSNLTLFVQMPKVFQLLYDHAAEDKKADMKSNQDLILSFIRIGFQLTYSGNGLVHTQLIAEHDPDASLLDLLERTEETVAEQLFTAEFDSMRYIPDIPEYLLEEDGRVKLYWDEDSIKAKVEAYIKDGELDGACRLYYESGNLYGTLNFDEGEAEGMAYFYYDQTEEAKKVEFNLEGNSIEGTYREYYKSGKPKAMLEYKDNQPHGSAEFYYPSGTLRMEGQYKKGKRHRKFNIYSETGRLLNVDKYRRGEER